LEEGKSWLLSLMSSARARERSGHATMATAHTLFTQHHPSATSITFQSRFSGTLIARRAGTGPNEPIALDFPAAPLVTLEEGHRRRPKILEGVAKAVKGFEESQVVRVAWWDGHKAPIVELAAGTDLENLQITPAPLVRLEKRSFERLPLRNPH
jgi:predicted PhzF superfamily epimerase YddE/YHI9